MKLLYIHQHFSTPEGSTGTRSYEFAKAMIAEGHQVTILCGSAQLGKTGLTESFIRGKREGFVDGIHVIELQVPYSNHDGFISRAVKFLKFSLQTVKTVLKTQYDLLYATSTPITVAIPLVVSKLIKRRIPAIIEIRDLWPELPKAMGVIKNPAILFGIGLLERLAYRYADYGVGLSPGICEGMKRYKTLNDSTVFLIPNGCDIELFQKETLQPQLPELLQTLLTTKFTVVFPGAHGIANDLNASLDAAKILHQSGNQNIAFIFIGDGRVKPRLIERVKQESIGNCYFFDPLPKTRLCCVLQQADIGLMLLKNIPAFYYGTSPNKFFDYLAAGLPVLTNYPGWVAEIITQNKCGITVEPDHPAAFAKVLEQFSQLDEASRKQMGERALSVARQQFNRQKLAKQFIELCETAYGKNKAQV